MKSLENIDSFGAIDADNDDILLQVFEDHEAYRNIIDYKKFIIVGRKGTGKTAIFKKMLTLPKERYITFGHTFADYPWHYHDSQKSDGMPEHEKYVNSWKYLILLTLSKIILNYDASLPYDEVSLNSLTKIEQFVIDSYGTKDPDITQIFTPNRKLHLKPYLRLPGVIEAGLSPEYTNMSDLPKYFTEVNKNLMEHIFKSLNPENNYFICFDQLDLGFDPNSLEYMNRIIGLLLAAKDINKVSKENLKKCSIVIFLRDDIYDNLHFEDKNKLTQNSLSLIEWDKEITGNTLKNLMEKRFNNLLNNDVEIRIKWENVFDESKEMPGHQTKYTHITDRTYLRPRDIIKFSNEVLRQYKLRINLKEMQEKYFINQDINLARQEYGNYFYEELDDEIHKHIPNYKNYFEIFKSIGKFQFSLKEYIDAFEKRHELYPDITDPIAILKDLFEFSIIGYYKAGGLGYGGSEYVFKYIDRKAQFDSSSGKYRIHLGLLEALNLRRY